MDDYYVTKNFRRMELSCPCCGLFNCPEEFLNKIQELRDALGIPLHINSGCRCEKHNTLIRGENDSAHMMGQAVDILCVDKGLRYAIFSKAIEIGGFVGFGLYRDWIHLDTKPRPTKVIWIAGNY